MWLKVIKLWTKLNTYKAIKRLAEHRQIDREPVLLHVHVNLLNQKTTADDDD